MLVLNPTYHSLDILYEADLDSIRVPLQNYLNGLGLTSTSIAPGSLETTALNPAVQNILAETGTILEYYGTTLPAGYLWCNGALYTTSAQPNLFNVIGVTYGGTIGVNFNVPDKRDRVGIGRDTMGGTPANRVSVGVSGVDATAIGATGGNENLSAHTHGLGSAAVGSNNHINALNDPGHSHVIGRALAGGTPAQQSRVALANAGTTLSTTQTGTTTAVSANLSYGTTGSMHQHTGGGGGSSDISGTKAQQSVVQPTIVCNFIIKA